MIRVFEIKLPFGHAPEALPQAVASALAIPQQDIVQCTVFKRSFDARQPQLLVVYIADVQLRSADIEATLLHRHSHHRHIRPSPDMRWTPPVRAPSDFAQRPVIVGFGPCGFMAALSMAQMGFRPIVLERGKAVRERTQDTWDLWRKGLLHAESNVQFGEGGAGTFSDGKLYSQIRDPRHLGRKVMEELVKAGAPEEILYVAHPHIGTFKLVKVIESIRTRIIALGGEIRFQHRLTGLHTEPGAEGRERLTGLHVLDQSTQTHYELPCPHALLALGHSARDTFAVLHAQGVLIEPKPFSIGLRVEHPQGVIDHARWGRHAGNPALAAADYKLVHHARNGRTVYSFCMCPGGTVVAATSEEGHVVTNGMSQYSRNEHNANAGIVVGVGVDDFPLQYEHLNVPACAQGKPHPLAGLELQHQLETRAFILGGANYHAPAQLLGDFLAARASTAWAAVEPSYKPGVLPGDLHQALPGFAVDAMCEAFPAFGRQIAGFDMHDAVLTGVETRTSSPIRITRRDSDLQSVNVRGLYPGGEGAGYAGGILSAGIDGVRIAEAMAQHLLKGG